MIQRFFVTGTDTGVGKTLVSSILTLALSGSYWKPIQSGIADEESEQEKVRALTGLEKEFIFPSTYSLKASLSPDQAAKREAISIDLKKIILPETSRALIVEGAGGVFVPLNATETILDLIKQLNFPVIIVSRGGLGTINHTLLTIEALRNRQLTIHGVIFSGELNPENQDAIEKFGKVRTLFHVPFFEKIEIKNWVKEQRETILEGLR